MQSAKDQFSELVKRTLLGFINDKVSDRLRSALARADGASVSESPPSSHDAESPEDKDAATQAAEDGIVTTEEELQRYRIVKAIVCDLLAPERVTYRDSKTYFAVLVDSNNRKPICRLHFNRSKKYIGTFDAEKVETRHQIDGPDGIYVLRDQLRATASHWITLDVADKPAATPTAATES